tara:strand:- start:1253 stop:1678 length:426 start_codon:yes stop_codon:yes gene_type:complete
MGERFKEDPFVLFQLRGRSRNKLLADLAELRREVYSTITEDKSEANSHTVKGNNDLEKPLPPHPAILDPTLWWQYEGSLNSDLVVITPSIDGENSLNRAGELPLADEPQYPKAQQQFLDHLNQQASKFAQQAMIQAMTTGS